MDIKQLIKQPKRAQEGPASNLENANGLKYSEKEARDAQTGSRAIPAPDSHVFGGSESMNNNTTAAAFNAKAFSGFPNIDEIVSRHLAFEGSGLEALNALTSNCAKYATDPNTEPKVNAAPPRCQSATPDPSTGRGSATDARQPADAQHHPAQPMIIQQFFVNINNNN